MSEFLNLEQVGALTRSGQQYAGNAEENAGAAKNHLAKMEGVQAGFRGAAGSVFQNISGVSVTNLSHLARQIADQAERAVMTERAAVTGDEEAHQGQQGTVSAAENFTSAAIRPINV